MPIESLHTLHFFHILLCRVIMLNCFKLLFFHINLHPTRHNDKAKLDLSQLCKFIQKEKLKRNDIAQVFIPLTQAVWVIVMLEGELSGQSERSEPGFH